jgi:hypothetical protein
MSVADIVVTFENTYSAYVSDYWAPDWIKNIVAMLQRTAGTKTSTCLGPRSYQLLSFENTYSHTSCSDEV